MHDTENIRTDVAVQPDRAHRVPPTIYERSDGVDRAWGGREQFDSLVDVEVTEEPT